MRSGWCLAETVTIVFRMKTEILITKLVDILSPDPEGLLNHGGAIGKLAGQPGPDGFILPMHG